MRRSSRWLCLFSSMLATFATCRAAPASEIVLCDFGVTSELRAANASFSIVYRIDIGDDGRVVGVSELRNDFLPGALSRWKFAGPKRRATVSLDWKHGEGWVSIVVSDPRSTLRIRFEPGFGGAR